MHNHARPPGVICTDWMDLTMQHIYIAGIEQPTIVTDGVSPRIMLLKNKSNELSMN